MEPRRYRRGDRDTRGLRDAFSWLQWGRDVTVAVTFRSLPPRKKRKCFNGAATLPSR